MPTKINSLVDRIKQLEEQLEQELEERRENLSYHIERNRVVFETEVRERHKQFKVRFWTFMKETRPLVVLTAPLIYGVVIPLFLLDLFVSVYQLICFPVYGIKRVKRRAHVVIDRHELDYLNLLQKFNCLYCSYGNGVLSYASEVAARTEQYWCPIKHARHMAGTHVRYRDFLEYGDAEGYAEGQETLRKKLKGEAE